MNILTLNYQGHEKEEREEEQHLACGVKPATNGVPSQACHTRCCKEQEEHWTQH